LFSFFHRKNRTKSFPFQELKVDVHSHLIPGIDDGSPDSETSIGLMKGMIDLGFERFTGTPHVMGDIWKNNPETIGEAHALLQKEMRNQGIDQPISMAAEYLVDEHLEHLIQTKQSLLTIRDNWVLIEISFIQPPMQLKEVIFGLQLNGYQPVFAHPERYSYYYGQKHHLTEIRDSGCLFQCNLLSFSGYYGQGALQAADWLASQGMVDLLGTDLHHERHLNGLRELKESKSLVKALEGLKQN
jgi:tyrosine-protein phosphatase YwqE